MLKGSWERQSKQARVNTFRVEQLREYYECVLQCRECVYILSLWVEGVQSSKVDPLGQGLRFHLFCSFLLPGL